MDPPLEVQGAELEPPFLLERQKDHVGSLDQGPGTGQAPPPRRLQDTYRLCAVHQVDVEALTGAPCEHDEAGTVPGHRRGYALHRAHEGDHTGGPGIHTGRGPGDLPDQTVGPRPGQARDLRVRFEIQDPDLPRSLRGVLGHDAGQEQPCGHRALRVVHDGGGRRWIRLGAACQRDRLDGNPLICNPG